MSEIFFITATGTEIGKSFYLQKLCQKYQEKKQKFYAIKPVISGFDIDDTNNDSFLILKALNLEINEKNLNKISPWRLKAPYSPNIAANLENREINLSEVMNFCQKEINLAKKTSSNLLIEGAGGFMTPINNQFTYLDLIKSLNIPVILVTANYLGTISHSLSAIEVLKNNNVKIAKIIFNNLGKNDISNQKNLEDLGNLGNLKNFTNIEIEEIGDLRKAKANV